MGDAEVLGEALQADVGGMLLGEFLKLLAGGPQEAASVGIFAAKLCGEIEGVGGHHVRKHGGGVVWARQGRAAVRSRRCGDMRSERMPRTLARSLRVFGGGGEELFSGALIEGDGVQLAGADGPPAGKGGADDEVGYELLPDEGLNIFGRDEVLLGGGEGVGEIGQRAHEVGSAAGRGADAEQRGGLPELFGCRRRRFR